MNDAVTRGLAVVSDRRALRENWLGYRGIPGQNFRSAPPLSSSVLSPGITPFLPNAQYWTRC